MGDENLQGLDYFYTLHGWMKGMNGFGNILDNDPMLDGITASAGTVPDFFKDAVSWNLHYFKNDYNPVAYSSASGAPLTMDISGTALDDPNYYLPLYNGNITQMTTTINDIATNASSYTPLMLSAVYRYDRLNRLKSNHNITFNFNQTSSEFEAQGFPTATAAWESHYDYDLNGNITHLSRSNEAGTDFDDLTYKYDGNLNAPANHRNQLSLVKQNSGVNGSFSNSNYSSVYTYDNSGNLLTDSEEGLTVTWNNTGKIETIYNSNTQDNIVFSYDAMGNRVCKDVEHSNLEHDITYYVRDAQGNIMATYTQKAESAADTYLVDEYTIYGSARLGVLKAREEVINTTPQPEMEHRAPGATVFNTHNNKQYEICNHLGNVLTVVQNNYNGVAYSQTPANYTQFNSPTLVASQDYYPFGSPMPNRNFSSGEYRYGFNGKEEDDEVKGAGNSLDFGARMLDTRIGRWLSVDALWKKYPSTSSYSFAANNPIYWIDPDGNDLYGANDADRQIVIQSVALVLGDAQDVFKFVGDKLEINPNYDPSQFKPDQNKFIEEFNNTIVSNTDIKVYVHNTDAGVNVGDGEKVKLGTFEPESTEETAPGVVDLYVNPNEKSQKGVIFDDLTKEGKKQTKDLTKVEKAEIEKKDAPKIAFFHGIGHALQFAKKREGADHEKKTVGFENFIRSIVGLPERAGGNHGVVPGTQGSDPNFE